MTVLTKSESLLLVGFMAVVSVPLLYLARALDSNSLSSWRWVLNQGNIGAIILCTLLAALGAAVLSWTAFFERRPLFWLFTLSFLVSASLWGEPELLLDSGRYFLQAKQLSEQGWRYFAAQWGGEIQAWTDMPLGPLLYGLIFRLFGESREFVQLFNSLLFALAVVLTSLSARMVINRESAFAAGLLLLGIPYLLLQVPQLLVDIHALFFFSLALYTFLTGLIKGGKARGSAAAVSIVLAMLSKYSIWPMLLILPLLVAGFWRPDGLLRFRRAMAMVSLAGLLVGLILLPKLDLVKAQLALLAAYQRPALGVWQEGLFSTFFFQTQPLLTVFALLGLFEALRRGNGRLLLLAVFMLCFFYQVQRSRYIIPLLPLLAMLAASGLQTLRFPETRRFVCWLGTGSALVMLHGASLPFFAKSGMSNIQQAGLFLDRLPASVVEVVTLPQPFSAAPTTIAIAQLDLFTRQKIIAPQAWTASPPPPAGGYHPLLFTWQIKKPRFYAPPLPGPARQDLPLVIISGSVIADSAAAAFGRPARPAVIRHFTAQAEVFRYQTFVSVFY